MESEQAERILKEHIRLCSDMHELFIEEGRIMRSTGLPPDEAFLKCKETFLPILDNQSCSLYLESIVLCDLVLALDNHIPKLLDKL